MGKEAWIAKIDEARIQRKLSGVIAILMALAVSYAAMLHLEAAAAQPRR